ncbi:MAG TPA: hypothetical protein VLA45_03120, partial [Paracoccaceae bacterium]|nr:hypothetical protein [Paracoccaceae bacterium]
VPRRESMAGINLWGESKAVCDESNQAVENYFLPSGTNRDLDKRDTIACQLAAGRFSTDSS